jgi:hypothetical protein
MASTSAPAKGSHAADWSYTVSVETTSMTRKQHGFLSIALQNTQHLFATSASHRTSFCGCVGGMLGFHQEAAISAICEIYRSLSKITRL